MDLNHTPLFRSLWEGSMVGMADPQLVFLFLLAHADADDQTDIHPSAIAALTGLPPERVSQALEFLESPDPTSRRAVEDGRRILRIDTHRSWGWKIVNRDHYKHLYSNEMHRRADREYQRRKRASTTVDSPSTTVDSPSTTVDSRRLAVDLPSVQAVGSRQEAVDKEEEASKAPLGRADARLTACFRPGLIEELQTAHPTRDVPSIAAKLLEPQARPVKNYNRALRNWVAKAETNNWDALPTNNGTDPEDLSWTPSEEMLRKARL